MNLGTLHVVPADAGSARWLRAREGRATASQAHRILTDAGVPRTGAQVETYAIELAAEVLYGESVQSFSGSSATEHGHEQEPAARAAHAFALGVDIDIPGVCWRDAGVACSPDGIAVIGGERVLCEYKSPLPVQAVRARRYAREHGAPMGQYLPQIHWSLWVLDLALAEHVIWATHAELDEQLSRTRVERSAEWDAACAEAAATVLGLRDEIVAAERGTTTTTTDRSAA